MRPEAVSCFLQPVYHGVIAKSTVISKNYRFFGGRAHKKGAKIKSSLRRKQFAVDIGLVDGDELQLRSVLDINFIKTLFIVHIAQVYYTGSGRNEDAEFCLTVYLMSLYKGKTRTLPRMRKKTPRKRPTEIFIWQRLFFSELIRLKGWQNKDLFHDPLDTLNPRP